MRIRCRQALFPSWSTKQARCFVPARSSFLLATASTRAFSLGTCLLYLTCVFGTTHGQQRLGAITGYAKDQAGAHIVKTHIAVWKMGSGPPRTTETRDDGSFTINNLEPGEYSVEAQAYGFNPASLRVILPAGERIAVVLELQPGPATEPVERRFNVSGISSPESGVKGQSDPLNESGILDPAHLGIGANLPFVTRLGAFASNLREVNLERLVGILALLALQSLLIIFLLVERHKLQQARKALGKSESRNQAILRAIPDLMFLQDKDGTYLDYHAKDPSLLLVPAAVFLGKKMEDVLPPQLCAEFHECFERAFETGEIQLHEYSLPIGGEMGWYEARVALSSGDNLLTIVRDITESRRSKEALRESERRFATAFESNPQPMSLTTLETGRFVSVNQSFLDMSGFALNEVIGRSAVELNIWESPADRELLMRQMHQKGSVRDLEIRLRTKSGAIRTLLMAGEVVELGNRKSVLVSAVDITERKQAEQRLSELTAHLLKTQDKERRRIAEELHDVTAQDIGLILLNLAYLSREVSELDLRSKDKLAESIALGEQALREIRTLSYVLHPPLLDQAGLVTALQWYAKGFTERSGIRVDFAQHGNDGQRMPIEVEYSLFRVVQECLTNIRRHTNSETASIALTRTEKEVVLEVQDHGTGLRLETPTNGDCFESLGVGIPGMRHRLKQLGGELAVESAPNGTTVTATVPAKWVVYDSYSAS